MKKRVLAIILVLVLALPMLNVPAYADYDGEILFRGIPWGSNYQDTMDALKADGVNIDSADVPSSTVDGIVVNVGGYSMELELHFMSLDRLESKEDGCFYKAGYRKFFNCTYTNNLPKVKTITQEYLLKLTSLYGDPDDSWSSKTNDGWELKYYQWNGADKSVLQLGYGYSTEWDGPNTYKGYELQIKYESEQAYDDFKEKTAEEKARREAEKAEKERQELEQYINNVLSNVNGL